MLEKPKIAEETLITSLQDDFDLYAKSVTFLPLGADHDTAVFRVETFEQESYFLKLRSGSFAPSTVLYPAFLRECGIEGILAPIPTQTGQLWGRLEHYRTILFPFIEGKNGYEIRITEQHWLLFGKALKQMHMAPVPAGIVASIPHATLSSEWRDRLVRALSKLEQGTAITNDPAAHDLAQFLMTKRVEIVQLLDYATDLATALQSQPLEMIVCHGDLHAGNIFISREGNFYIVDWDTLCRAPKERDLMYIGGSLMAGHRSPSEEEALFYQSYGETKINVPAIAYYRAERVLEDLVIYCEQLLFSNEGGADRERALHSVQANFLPGGTIERAYSIAL